MGSGKIVIREFDRHGNERGTEEFPCSQETARATIEQVLFDTASEDYAEVVLASWDSSGGNTARAVVNEHGYYETYTFEPGT